MRFLKIIIMLILVSCSTAEKQNKALVKKEAPIVPHYDLLTREFIIRCESDLLKSASVIGKDRLISSLSHLNIMDKGGRKYYLLEQDNITRMLNNLTSYPYSECFLVDKKGKIVYTMRHGEPLGKKVSFYKETPVFGMFLEGLKGNSIITDVMYTPQLAKDYNMFFSQPVRDPDGETQGVIVSAVSIERLAEKLPEFSRIINGSGSYSYHDIKELILKKDTVSESRLIDIGSENFNRVKEQDGVYLYQQVHYKNIRWLIAVREKTSMVMN